MFLDTLWPPLAYLLLALVLLLLAKLLKECTTAYRLEGEIHERDNVAVALGFTGYLMAVLAIVTGASLGPGSGSLATDLLTTAAYAALGIALLGLARLVNDRLILRRFSLTKELVEDRNAGTGAVEFGSYLGSGLIVAGAVHGEGGGILTATVFFLLGQLAFWLFSLLYNALTPHDVHDEIERDNVAAGVAYGGTLVALGVVLMHAAAGDFVSWRQNLSVFGLEALAGVVLLVLLRGGLDKLLLARMDLHREIARDRNLGAALIEAGAAISFAVLLVVVIG